MELPKNIVQIGKPDRTHKIFVEDYVISYIKQLNKACEDKAVGLALYGRLFTEEDCRYYFLYGAAPIVGLEHRGPYLSQVEKEEIADVGNKYFEEYEFLAWCSVRGEPVESFYVQVQGKGIEIGGYACFYEKNESMLNYMLSLGGQQRREKAAEEQKEPERPVRGDWKAADYIRPAQKPAKGKPAAARKAEYGKLVVAAALLILCVVGITTLNDYEKLEDLQVAARQVIASMSEQKLPDAQPENDTQNMDEESSAPGTDGENVVSGLQGAGGTPGIKGENGQTGSDSVSGTDAAATQSISGPDAAFTSNDVAGLEDDKKAPVAEQALPVAYTVVKGDTLNSICMSRYGSLERLQEICEMNGITNADSIQIGQTILLP